MEGSKFYISPEVHDDTEPLPGEVMDCEKRGFRIFTYRKEQKH